MNSSSSSDHDVTRAVEQSDAGALGMKLPPGYCLDPNGKVITPEGKGEDFSFGYDTGFREAWDILSRVQKVAPELLHLLRCWAALDGGAWHVERHAREKASLIARTDALIVKATGAAK